MSYKNLFKNSYSLKKFTNRRRGPQSQWFISYFSGAMTVLVRGAIYN